MEIQIFTSFTYYMETTSESDMLILGDMIHTIILKISLPLGFFEGSCPALAPLRCAYVA